MKKLIAFTFVALVLFSGVDCNDEPVQPPTNSDTTSHNFTWKMFTWGGGGASSINDVAIISDTNIWAVGEIQFTSDSTYNAAYWNGQQWTFLNIPTERFGGTIGNSRLNTIIAFSANDIWTFSIAGSYSHWDGAQWTTKFVAERSGGGTKFWGTSSSNLYLIGTNGSITYYNGSSWQKVESGTTLDLRDIYGTTDNKTGEQQILAVGSKNIPFDRVLLRIQGTTVTTLSSSLIESELSGVWFKPNQHYYVVGDGIFEKNSLSETSWKNKPLDITSFYTSAVTGNDLNDVFIVGAFGECLHWNGASWYSYRNVTMLNDGYLGVAAVKENTLIVGGQTVQDAIIMIGKR